MACRVNRAEDWAYRMHSEARYYDKNCFVTLTYSDDNLPISKSGLPTLRKKDFRQFVNSVRVQLGRSKDKRKIKYYVAGEYGDLNNRPHYHAIFFGISPEEFYRFEKTWHKGFVDARRAVLACMLYVAKYVTKAELGFKAKIRYHELGIVPAYNSSSNGLGLAHYREYKDYFDQNPTHHIRGYTQNVPQYYMRKIKETNPDAYQKIIDERKRAVKQLHYRFYRDKCDSNYSDYAKRVAMSGQAQENDIKGRLGLRRRML
jgi:hypothetical protein